MSAASRDIRSPDTPLGRALYYAPKLAFDRPIPPVPATIFLEERERACDPSAPTGMIALNLASALELDWPATTPTMLARYIVLRRGETLSHQLNSSGEVYYVLKGDGSSSVDRENVEWRMGDAFCFPGGRSVLHGAGSDALLIQVTNEPELAYLRANAPQDGGGLRPTHYQAAMIDDHLREVHGRNEEQRAAGKSVVLLTGLMQERRVTTPTLLAAVNSLKPGADQRPHRHSSAALTLSIHGEGTFSRVGEQEIAWRDNALMVTPPGVPHSHHNRGTRMMKSFVVQDTGLHSQLRTTNFAWTD